MTALVELAVLYFGALRDAAGTAKETRLSTAADLGELWEECAAAHGLSRATGAVRVAVDGDFADWGQPVRAGSEVAFLPPFTGG